MYSSKKFLVSFRKCFKLYVDDLSLQEFDLHFGYDVRNCNSFINQILLHGKYYILNCKYNIKDVDYDNFIMYLCHTHDIVI